VRRFSAFSGDRSRRYWRASSHRDCQRTPVRIMHATLQAMLKAAADDGVILSNPAEKLGRQLHLVASAATRQEEIKAMIGEQRHLFFDDCPQRLSRNITLCFLHSRMPVCVRVKGSPYSTKISFTRADMDRQIIPAAYTKSLYGGMERTNPRPYSLR